MDESESDSKNEDLIQTGRLMAHYENSIHYGPTNGTLHQNDDEGSDAWDEAYKNVFDELEERFERGDESLLDFWRDFCDATEDVDKKRHIIMKAAELGSRHAQNELAKAYCYAWGKEAYGIPQDSEKAAYWYDLVTENASASDQSYLAYIYREGAGCLKPDPEKSAYWSAKAAETKKAEEKESSA